jgi:O-methyltransferase domain/Dimerisation domain
LSNEMLAPDGIMRLGLGFMASKTLLSAVELGVFNELANGPLDLDTLVTRLKLYPRAIADFFDSLVALGVLERENGLYRNTPESDHFLVRGKLTYIGGILEMANERLYPFWGSLTEGLQTGQPQNEVKAGGPGLFEALYGDPERLHLFLAAMTGLSLGASMAIARKFPWSKYKTVVDVGGAQGGLLVQVCRATSNIRGFNFDLPQVKAIFEDYVRQNQLEDRLKFLPGNFFEDPLPSADVITMGHILHDWNLDEKRVLLQKAWHALPEGGALIVFEALIDDDRRQNVFGLLMSLNMLIETPGGFDYTGKDCSGWMRDAGFRETRVEHLIGPDSMVIGFK